MQRDTLLIKSFRDSTRLMSRGQRRMFYLTLGLGFFAAIIDMAGMALLLPPVLAIVNPELLYKQVWLQDIISRFGSSNETALIMFSFTLVMLFMLKNVILIFIDHFTGVRRQKIADSFAVKLLEHYTYLPWKQLQAMSPSFISYNTISVSNAFAQNLLRSLYLIFSEGMIMLIATVLLGVFNPRLLLLLAMTLIPTTAVVYYFIRRRSKTLAEESSRLSPDVYKTTQQFYYGNLDIRLSNSFQAYSKTFSRKKTGLSRLLNLQNTYSNSSPRLVEAMLALAILLIVCAGTYLISDRQSMALTVMLFATLSLRLLPSINRIITSFLGLKSYQFTLEILKQKEKTAKPGTDSLPFEFKIELDDITVTYPEEIPLLGLSLTLKKGSCSGLYGRSGSGKSSLLNVLAGFMAPSDGKVYIDNQKLGQDNLGSWWSKLAYAKQDAYLAEGSIKENIAFGLPPSEINEERVIAVLAETGLFEWVNSLPKKLETAIAELGSNISGGQKQLIALARALYRDAEVFLLDEVTSSLDASYEAQLINVVKRLKAKGKTILIVAHRIPILQCCDEIYELKDKTISRKLSYDELLTEYQSIQRELVN